MHAVMLFCRRTIHFIIPLMIRVVFFIPDVLLQNQLRITLGVAAIGALSTALYLFDRNKKIANVLGVIGCYLIVVSATITNGGLTYAGTPVIVIMFAIYVTLAFGVQHQRLVTGLVLGLIALLVLFNALGFDVALNHSDEGVYAVNGIPIRSTVAFIFALFGYWFLIRKEHRRDQALFKQAKALEHADQVKSRFISNMAHEMRNPLNGISGVIQILQRRDYIKAEDKALIESSAQSTNQLQHTIDDVLDVFKLESNTMAICEQPCNIKELADDLATVYGAQCQAKGLKFEYVCDENLHQNWQLDPDRVAQVIHNLVNNAIKFTALGTITLAVEEFEKDQQSHLLLRIKDTGIGLSEQDQKNIFERFVQVNDSTTKQYAGIGLGLSICKELTALMGGNIEVVSAPNKGCEFRVYLPLTKLPASLQLSRKRVIQEIPDLSACKVLLVEDNEINQTILMELLKPSNVTMLMADNAFNAIIAAKKHSFDLIISDITMPRMDGVTMLGEIRKIWPDLPAIALTGNVNKHDIEHYYASGFNSVVSKPVNIEALYTEILQTLPQDVLQANADEGATVLPFKAKR